MIVKDVMSTNPVFISPEKSVTEAKALMTKRNISKLPVLDHDRLVGIITKNDLLQAGPSSATTLDVYEISYLLSKLTVEKVMCKKVITIPPTEVVEEAARIMVDNQIGCLPVMQNDMLTGIITESDLFNLFTDMFGARQKGVRVTCTVDDRPGQLEKMAKDIADLKGNIISVVTLDVEDKQKRRLTVKATGVTAEQMAKIIDNCGGTAEDIRIV